MVEHVAQTMESDMANYLKRKGDSMVKLKGVAMCLETIWVCIVTLVIL